MKPDRRRHITPITVTTNRPATLPPRLSNRYHPPKSTKIRSDWSIAASLELANLGRLPMLHECGGTGMAASIRQKQAPVDRGKELLPT